MYLAALEPSVGVDFDLFLFFVALLFFFCVGLLFFSSLGII